MLMSLVKVAESPKRNKKATTEATSREDMPTSYLVKVGSEGWGVRGEG